MKAKDLTTALKYFRPIISERNLPSKVTEWRNDFTDEEVNAFCELPNKDKEIRATHYVAEECDVLEYYDDFLAWGLGHARRGQHYYLLCHKDSLLISVLASKPDGDGCSIELPNELINAILAGDIIHSQPA